MNTSIDSKTLRGLCGPFCRLLILCVVIFPLLMGCSDGNSDASSSPNLMDSHLATRLGKLHFVTDLAAGQALAAKQSLPCLIFFTAEWCTFCHQMENTAFEDASVAELAENFICIRIDADHERAICQQFGISGFPTVQFVSARGQALHRLVGRQSAAELTRGMQAALERVAWLDETETQTR